MNIKSDVKRPVKNLKLTFRVLGLGIQVLGLDLEPHVPVKITARATPTFVFQCDFIIGLDKLKRYN